MSELRGIVIGNVRVVSFTTEDREVIEEYDLKDNLISRRWRPLGIQTSELASDWTWEVGQPPLEEDTGRALSALGLRAVAGTPKITREETDDVITFIIAPLDYPADTYTVSLEGVPPQVVVRTKNKKYFKKLAIPVVDDVYSVPSWTWSRGALTIRVRKPSALIALEATKRQQRADMFSGKKS